MFTGPVNVGNPQELRMLDIAQCILDLTGSRSTLEFRPLPADDPTQRCPDISLARRELDWRPTVGLRDGLMRTIAYFERLLSSAPSGRNDSSGKDGVAATLR